MTDYTMLLQAGYRHIDTAWEYGIEKEVLVYPLSHPHLVLDHQIFSIEIGSKFLFYLVSI